MNCFICQSPLTSSRKPYLYCAQCCHEQLEKVEAQSFIVNEVLSRENMDQTDSLDQFKTKVLKECTVDNDLLVDVGIGSGKFLYQNKSLFNKVIGIEVTKECIQFARELGLNVKTNFAQIDSAPSVVTFWHSLEHMKSPEIAAILSALQEKSSPSIRVLISVPNIGSLQYKMFYHRFTYYDDPNHAQQFSSQSLNLLMKNYGFIEEKRFFSFAYSGFGYLQSFLNCANRIHNYFYYRKKRGWHFNKTKSSLVFFDLLNYTLALFFILPSFIGTLFDFLFPNKAGVITKCYRKI